MLRQAVLTAAAVFWATTAAVAAQDYFVSPSGSDSNDGRSLDRPFKTIQKAASVMQAGDSCRIRQGVYREQVKPSADGQADAPITFEAYQKERVVVSGLEQVKDWKKNDDGSWQAAMPGDFFKSRMNQADQVFVDEQMMHLAQWPNPSKDISRPAKSTFTKCVSKTRDSARNMTMGVIEDDALPPLSADQYKGAGIYVQPNKNAWSWTFCGTVVSCSGQQIAFESRNDSGKDGQQNVYPVGSRYYLYGHKALMDVDGEWYHDISAGVLYLRPPGGKDPNALSVEAKAREFGFDLTDRAYVTIRGIAMFGCTITTDRDAGGDGLGYDKDGKVRYPWRGKGSVAKSNHVTLEGIDAKYVSHFTDVSGHFFMQWGQNTGIVLSGADHVIKGSRVQYSAGNGITLLGQGCKATDNLITDVDYVSVDCAAVCTGGAAPSQDHEIAYNTIVRCARSGISYRGLRNSDPSRMMARIHHNDISLCALQDCDAGALYAANHDTRFLRIDHNLLHDIDGFSNVGVYADYCRNVIIDHNIMWNLEWPVEVQGDFQGATNALIYNNTMICKNMSNSPYGPFGVAGGKGSKAGTIIRNNIIACVSENSKGYKAYIDNVRKTAEIADNLLWEAKPGSDTDPKFADLAKGDFRLGDGSKAIGAGKPVPELERDGIKVPPFNEPADAHAVDLGALPAKSEPLKAGCTSWGDAERSKGT